MKSNLFARLFLIILLANEIFAKSVEKRQFVSCLSCVSALSSCAATGCGGFFACTACVTGIAAGCGACANDLCNANRMSDLPKFEVVVAEPRERLSCVISPSLCDFHCRCRYSKRGTCSGGTCYCG
ncbi:unnamed protein product [Brachionus calyciflorus]|uniref:Uncharacterized protein n=1 Tax=Brachionus calyciflorus TaxID=104777 RepID=A0A814BJ89_9BILA|nr:unnamed protein product [Brachionus calyciflorus]